MPTLINPDQTGYVKGRYIGGNVRLIYDLIHYADKLNQKGITIFLDFKEVFDSTELNYLLEALQLFNFGHDIQNWIKLFYNNVTSCVLNNGHASPFFSLQRGVTQGCPLSGILFVLGIELLSRSIKNDPTIKGIRVNKHELKISQYADDTTVFVRDLDSVMSLLRVLNDFKEYSGLEINTTKTEAERFCGSCCGTTGCLTRWLPSSDFSMKVFWHRWYTIDHKDWGKTRLPAISPAVSGRPGLGDEDSL